MPEEKKQECPEPDYDEDDVSEEPDYYLCYCCGYLIKGMSKMKTELPCKELRRFETIYKTFLKMNSDQRSRVLQFMIDKFHSDIKKQKQ